MLRNSCKFLGKTLVIAEAGAGNKLSPATLSAVTAASKCGSVAVLTAGSKAKELAAEAAKVAGVQEAIAVDGAQFDNGLAENWGPLIAEAATAGGYSHVFCGCTTFGKTVLGTAAGKLDVMPIPDITGVVSEDTFVRLLYAGNAVNTVKSTDKVKLVSVRATAFDKAATAGGSGKVTEGKTAVADAGTSKFVERMEAKSDSVSLTEASIVVAGGRGLKNKEDWKRITDMLVAKLPKGATVGATRAVVDAEWCSYDLQIGQTGKIIAPQLYFGIGVSGAVQHAAGIKDSKTIVAINTDNEAPIVALADYTLVEDAFKAVPELAAKL